MRELISWIIVFILAFLFYLIFVVLNKKKRHQIFDTPGAKFMKIKFQVNFKKTSEKKFALIISTINAIIFATTFTIMTLIDNMIISFLVAIPILLILIIALYSLLGIIYKKKEVKENV